MSRLATFHPEASGAQEEMSNRPMIDSTLNKSTEQQERNSGERDI